MPAIQLLKGSGDEAGAQALTARAVHLADKARLQQQQQQPTSPSQHEAPQARYKQAPPHQVTREAEADERKEERTVRQPQRWGARLAARTSQK